jgi:hypothetical protein
VEAPGPARKQKEIFTVQGYSGLCRSLLTAGLPLLVGTAAAGCAPPPKPPVSPPAAAPQPERELVSVDFDKLLVPPVHEEIVAPRSLDKICRVLVASADKRLDVKASGASSEGDELRILRRAIMNRKRDVVTGEVGARVSAETVGSSGNQDAVARFNALSEAERLVLLAEKTGAQALLVLDKAGLWSQSSLVEVNDSGKVTVRDLRQGETANGCGDSPAKFVVEQWNVGIRAKLVSLKKDDASILADIDMFAPVSDPLGSKSFAKWKFTPVEQTYCSDYVLVPQVDRWMCVPGKTTVSYTQEPIWCGAMVNSMVKTQEEISSVRYLPRFETMAKRLAEKLFSLQQNCVPERSPAPPVAAPAPETKAAKKR